MADEKELIDDGRRDKTSREDLVKIAEAEGIEVGEKDTKADIVKAINAKRSAEGSDPTDEVDAPTMAYDTSEFQPKEGEKPVYFDGRTKQHVTPHGKVVAKSAVKDGVASEAVVAKAEKDVVVR